MEKEYKKNQPSWYKSQNISSADILDIKLWKQFVSDLWFSQGSRFSSTNKSDQEDIAKLLFKVAAVNTKTTV
jgi:hypothetical protein